MDAALTPSELPTPAKCKRRSLWPVALLSQACSNPSRGAQGSGLWFSQIPLERCEWEHYNIYTIM